MAITASEARKALFPLIEQVNDDHTPVEITSKRGDAVLMSKADYDALTETAYLLRVPANARRLLDSLAQWQELVLHAERPHFVAERAQAVHDVVFRFPDVDLLFTLSLERVGRNELRMHECENAKSLHTAIQSRRP